MSYRQEGTLGEVLREESGEMYPVKAADGGREMLRIIGLGEVESKSRDLGSDRGYRVEGNEFGHTGEFARGGQRQNRRQDAGATG